MIQRIFHLDQWVLLRVRRLHAPSLTKLMKTFTHLGDATSWFIMGFILWTAGQRDYAYLLGIAAVLAAISAQVVKRAWRRPRPSSKLRGFTALVDNPDAYSFPSGHSATAVAVAVALAGLGVGLGVTFLVLAVGIAVSRIYLGAHYPLDVMAGTCIGVLSGLATPYVLVWMATYTPIAN